MEIFDLSAWAWAWRSIMKFDWLQTKTNWANYDDWFNLMLCLFPCPWHSVYHHVDSGGCIWKDCALLHLGALHIAIEWGLLRSSFGLRNKRWTCQKLQVIRSESIKPLLTGKTYMLINFCWIKLKLNWTDLTPSAQAQWAQKRFASSCATLVTIPRRPSSRLI